MKSNKRIFRTVICIAVLFAMVFSAFCVVAEADHYCTGDHCAICCQIELYKNLLRSLAVVAGIIGAIVIGKLLCGYCREGRNDGISVPTLVVLGVKLSD